MTIKMETIYRITGTIVVWVLTIGIALLSIAFIIWSIWALSKRYGLILEKIAYYFGATIDNYTLREAYKQQLMKHTKKLCFKYRLRNIRKASKQQHCY